MSQPADMKRKRKQSKERNKENKIKIKKMVQSEGEVIGKSRAWMKKGKCNSEKKVTERRIRAHSKIFVNAKPMPSLSDLEKMFEDSDDEVSPTSKEKIPTRNNILPQKPRRNIDILTNTPEEIIDLIEDSTNIAELVPAKSPKTSCIPYIVDTSELPRIPMKSSTHFRKCHDDYETNSITNDLNDEKPLSRKVESILNDNSNDSTLTITYDTDLNMSSAPKRCTFSPIPSTSNDNEIFLKNDQLLMESLCDLSSNDLLANVEPLSQVIFNESIENNVEIITSFDHGSTQNETSKVTNNIKGDDIKLFETSYETITIDDEPIINNGSIDNEPVINNISIDNSVQIIDVDSYEPNINSSLDSSDCVLIDVDNVLAENQLLLEKYKNKYSDSIINVTCEKNCQQRQENLENDKNVEGHDFNQTINMATRTSILENKSSPQASQPVRNIECPICMDNLSKEKIVSTYCGHVFCKNCIKQALKMNGKKCPICRKIQKGTGKGFHKIFWPF